MKKIVLTGGGTAGHIYPALAVGEQIRQDFIVHYIGGSGMEKKIIKNEKGIIFHEIRTVKLERKLTPSNLLIPFKLFQAVRDARTMLKKIQPDVIFSKGGFVAVPVAIAGKMLGIPIVSHESDLSMGLANKIILKCCSYMCTAFPDTAKNCYKCVYTGQPIRKKVFEGNRENIKGDFDKNKQNLVVIGGSLGAKFINEKVWENLAPLTKKFNVVHITGKQAKEKHTHKNYLQVDYAENIGDYLAFADIILSRAGSGAINEFVALRKPALLIPLSKKCSRGDQIENAKLFKDRNLCDMLEEEECDNAILLAKLEKLSQNTAFYIKNMKNAQNFDSCAQIIELIKKVSH